MPVPVGMAVAAFFEKNIVLRAVRTVEMVEMVAVHICSEILQSIPFCI